MISDDDASVLAQLMRRILTDQDLNFAAVIGLSPNLSLLLDGIWELSDAETALVRRLLAGEAS